MGFLQWHSRYALTPASAVAGLHAVITRKEFTAVHMALTHMVFFLVADKVSWSCLWSQQHCISDGIHATIMACRAGHGMQEKHQILESALLWHMPYIGLVDSSQSGTLPASQLFITLPLHNQYILLHVCVHCMHIMHRVKDRVCFEIYLSPRTNRCICHC